MSIFIKLPLKFNFDLIEVEPDREGKYRILDGAHRFQAYKNIGRNQVPVTVISLNQTDPLLYSASRAIGPQQLTEDDARSTARRASQNNQKLTSSEIGKFIGRSRQAVDV